MEKEIELYEVAQSISNTLKTDGSNLFVVRYMVEKSLLFD